MASPSQPSPPSLSAPPSGKPAVVWFRNDLRLSDNPALHFAAEQGYAVLPLFILDDEDSGQYAMGAASRWWLHHSLAALTKDLSESYGLPLVIRSGKAEDILTYLTDSHSVEAVFWNRSYEPWCVARDKRIKERLTVKGVSVRSFAASMLYEPWEIMTGAGKPYTVFSPYWKALLKRPPPDFPMPRPGTVKVPGFKADTLAPDELGLLPSDPDWAAGFNAYWTPGEAGARQGYADFLEHGLKGYADRRNIPSDLHGTSRLSPHIHFGEIGPRTLWHAAFARIHSGEIDAVEQDIYDFLREIGWRDFNKGLLFHFPEITERNFKPEFDRFPWAPDDSVLRAWQRGRTGYPLVDAGMRELWATGYMHNRVRMVVASFLIKHLLQHWKEGEAWFRDTLVDADLANNVTNWQWVAGSGADAAPYFRIFNPTSQAERFDPKGDYIRKWVPELAGLSAPHIHSPWNAPIHVLKTAGVEIGKTYPRPIVEHDGARKRALDAYEVVRKGREPSGKPSG